MNKSKKRTIQTIIVMVIVFAVIISGYYFIRTRTNFTITQTDTSEADKLISKDIKGNYPYSPREVLKLYSRIAKSYYNEDLTQKEIESLAGQMRLLFDDDLLAKNQYEDYISKLKNEIEEYNKAGRTIINYVIEESDAVEYWEEDSEQYASLITSYTLKEGSNYTKIYEKFLLRQDKDKEWKIMGWSLSDSPGTLSAD